jgi:hypothetical protein
VSKIWSAALALKRRVTFVLGVGFDPRALVALKSLLTQVGNQIVRVVRLGLPSAEDDDLTRELTHANDRCLKELVESGVVEVAPIAYPEGVESRAAGLRMSRQIQSSGVIGAQDLIVVDVSGLPSSVYFPVIGGLLKASDDQGLQRDIQVVVCENPELDRIILDEGVASPGPISGFRQRLDPDDASGVTRVWVPVLGEHQEPYIRSIFDFLAPNEVCPVLPFPARNPRRGDDLLVELRSLIADFRSRKLPHNGQGQGYSKTTGRLRNHGIGRHPLSRAASRRMGLCARLSKRTTMRSACILSWPPVSTNLR